MQTNMETIRKSLQNIDNIIIYVIILIIIIVIIYCINSQWILHNLFYKQISSLIASSQSLVRRSRSPSLTPRPSPTPTPPVII
jgi:hypothetical protein